MKIQDSVAFVTGAHRGLGLAFTKELLGHDVKKVYGGTHMASTCQVSCRSR